MFQEAATSTQEGSSDSQSSNEEKIMIALHKEPDHTDIVIADPIETMDTQSTNQVANE